MPESEHEDGRDTHPGPGAEGPAEVRPLRRPEQQDAGRERLWRALLRPTRGQLIVALLLALVGFAAVTQVRTNQVDDTYAGLREQDLIDILNGLAGTTQRAQSEIQRLEDTRDDLQSDTNARQVALDQARTQAEALSILAGVVPVTGPGVRITIKEVEGQVEVGPFIDMVQALRTGGAEAMQINHELRVVAQTSFADGTGGLLIDGQLISGPYIIDVIGEPGELASALRFPGGPQDEFAQDDGAELTFDELTSLRIESVRDPAEADYAQAQQ